MAFLTVLLFGGLAAAFLIGFVKSEAKKEEAESADYFTCLVVVILTVTFAVILAGVSGYFLDAWLNH